MNEKLPILHQAIQDLKKEKDTENLANELTILVEELSAQLEKKELVAIQSAEEKITQFLAEHEKEITIGNRQEDLETLKGTISSGTEEKPNKKQSSRRARLWGNDDEEAEAQEPEEPSSSRRERPRAKALGIGLLIGGGIYAFKKRHQNVPHTSTLQPVTSHALESASSVAYEHASRDMKRGYCFQYLQQIGFSKILAAGIVGNIQQESGFDTSAIGDNGAAHYLCQRRDGRRKDIQDFCASPAGRGRPITDYTLQLDFIKFELEGKERNAYAYLKKAKTPTEAATIFVEKYERAGTPHTENRIAYANQVFEQDSRNLA